MRQPRAGRCGAVRGGGGRCGRTGGALDTLPAVTHGRLVFDSSPARDMVAPPRPGVFCTPATSGKRLFRAPVPRSEVGRDGREQERVLCRVVEGVATATTHQIEFQHGFLGGPEIQANGDLSHARTRQRPIEVHVVEACLQREGRVGKRTDGAPKNLAQAFQVEATPLRGVFRARRGVPRRYLLACAPYPEAFAPPATAQRGGEEPQGRSHSSKMRYATM